MENNSNKIINGIFLVEKKWDLIWLKNKPLNIEETLPYFKFQNLLFQSFNEIYVKKILDAINCEEKLIIDFDKSIVKLIKQKDEPFHKEMKKHFTVQAVQNWVDNYDPEAELDLEKEKRKFDIRDL